MFSVFIDGDQGTTGLRVRDRLAGREDISLLSLPEEKRKDLDARAAMARRADATILCLPDAASRELVAALGEEEGVILDASTAHRTDPRFTYGFPELGAAQAKAEAVARAAGPETPDAVVLGSDTIVVLHEEHGPIILGKPASRDEALAMLLHLSGRTHTVYTGCCIIWLSARGESRTELFYDAADVTFAEWPEDVLRAYAATGECDDKAGSYAIQGLGSFLVSGIKGQWATIVGLPVLAVAQRLMGGGSIAPRHCLGTNPLSK